MSVKSSFSLAEINRRFSGKDIGNLRGIGNLREKLKGAGEKVPTNIKAKEVLARALKDKSKEQREKYFKGLGLQDKKRKKIESEIFGKGEKSLHEQKMAKKAAEKKEKVNIYLGKRSAEETDEYKRQKGGWYKGDGYNQGFAGQAAGHGSNTGFAGPGQAPQTGQDNQPAGAPGRSKFQTIGGTGNPPTGDDKNNPPEPPAAPPITILPI
ncbi:hypothetical protein KJ586_03420 [Patescibacteria group bacterium]|nr:hypothetical protein [Patescibacteria group bacterium]MBU4455532.1 hypothetical protein [Patescibacteria group bacterium]MCG2691171.1 hypothetical protein [Candidatus Parcubacteria bacterium]